MIRDEGEVGQNAGPAEPERLSGPHEQERTARPQARTTGPQARPAGLHQAAPDAAFRDLLMAGAVVLSLVLPVIALVAALVMRVREHGRAVGVDAQAVMRLPRARR